jgi:transposase
MPPEQLAQEYTLLKAENAVLRAQIDYLKRQLYGSGKNERMDQAQLALKLGELEKQLAAAVPVQEVSYERRAPVDRVLPAENFADLPVAETVEIIPAEVQADPEAYERIGEERSFEVDILPPKLVKREIIRPKYQYRANRSCPPVVAPAAARAMAGGYASAGLMAWVVLNKYLLHQPLFRQEQISEQWGARISRQSMNDWVLRVSDWLQPLYRLMHRELLAGDYLQCDETPIRCNDPDEKRGGTSQGWLWVISRPKGDVVFDWRLSRRHGEVTSLLEGFRGVVHADAYPAYAKYVRDHEGLELAGCWAHCRRRYREALEEAPKGAGFVLRQIGQMYHLEQIWDEAGWTDSARRAQLRQEHFAEPLRRLHKVAKFLAGRARPRSLLGEACHYLLAQWPSLTAHLRFGQTKLDTNVVENSIRPTKLGARNWLFIGHPDAGERSAIIYSVVISCRRHGIDPHTYLRDVLTRLPTMTNQDDLRPLLPSQWKPA